MPSRPLSDRQSQLSASGHAPSLHGRQQKSEGIVITGNKALNGGGAMYIDNKVVDIKGKVNISGNTLTDTGATPSNVLLYTAENTCKLNVNGTLDTTTPIGDFNLSGQRVSMPQKGVYIKNGKKVIVK